MALDLDSAINAFGSLSISQDALRFNPSKDQNSIRRGLHDVPPYLFRVHTPKSAGTLDEEWARSEDAKAALTDSTWRESSETDILQRRDFNHVAKDISDHLWWKRRVRCHDNLVSWTSSLLLALRYGHYRQQTESGLRLDEIKLCIVRTGGLRAGTFLRDAYLLDFYSNYDLPVPGAEDSQSLADMKSMRNKGWYFGEYLSQGALKIKGRCSIVSMRQLIDGGLLELSPNLQNWSQKPTWAKWVAVERTEWDKPINNENETFSNGKWQVVKKIASLFEPEFRLPIAAALVSLRPRGTADPVLIQKIYELRTRDRDQMDRLGEALPFVVDSLLPHLSNQPTDRQATEARRLSRYKEAMQTWYGSDYNDPRRLDDQMAEVNDFQSLLAELSRHSETQKSRSGVNQQSFLMKSLRRH